MRRVALALTLAVLAGLAGAAAAKDRALVVGINKYPGITLNGVPGARDLGGAVFDAHTFEGLLKDQLGVTAGDIHVLTDAEATRERILGEFHDWLIADTGPGDRVFFYYAGHGAAIRVEDPATGASRMTSAIVPSDAHGELAAEPVDIKGMILGTDMHQLLDQLPGRDVTVIADSCASGSVSRDALHPLIIPPNIKVRTLTPAGAVGMTQRALAADAPLRLKTKLNGRLLEIEPTAPQTKTDGTLAVWAAATTDQVTFDLGSKPGGIFTQSFADGLRDKKATLDDKGEVTAQALLNYIRDQAKQFCTDAGQACSSGLTPQLLSKDTYLIAPLEAAAVAPASAPAVQPDTPQPADPAQPSPAQPSATPVADKMSALLSHNNDFSLAATILPGPALKLGDVIHFRVVSGEAGKVAVFDLTPDGDLTQIFPNKKTGRDGRIRANAPLTMPDAYWGINFRATKPAGPGTLLVLVTEEGIDLDKATGGALDLKPIKETSRLLEVVGAELDKPVVSPKPDVPTRAARWAFVKVPYSVAP